MQRLAIGMKVCDVRNRVVGVVGRINSCCFEVANKPATTIHLEPTAIYNVESDVVDLICDSKEVSRYACGIHAG